MHKLNMFSSIRRYLFNIDSLSLFKFIGDQYNYSEKLALIIDIKIFIIIIPRVNFRNQTTFANNFVVYKLPANLKSF